MQTLETHSLLEIQIHLANGKTHKYIQDSPSGIRHILEHVSARIFEQPTLVVSHQSSVVTYPSAALAGISLLMEPLPQHLTHLVAETLAHQAELHEITEESYLAKPFRRYSPTEGQPFLMKQEVLLTSGERFFLQAKVPAVDKIQERHLLNAFFGQHALVCHRLGGGITLWNRAQIVRVSFSPKPEVPVFAWPAEAIAAEHRYVV